MGFGWLEPCEEIHTYVHTHRHAQMHAPMHMHMHTYIYIYMYINMYMHTHTHAYRVFTFCPESQPFFGWLGRALEDSPGPGVRRTGIYGPFCLV